MHPNRQGLADFAAAQAILARSRRVHLHHAPSSLCRFDGELVQEGTPARVVYLLGKQALGQAADVQVLDGDELVAVDDPTRELVHEVSPLIGDTFVDALEFTHGLPSAVRSLDAPCHLALCPPQAPLGALVPARVRNEVARAERREVLQAHVDADFGFNDG